MTFADYVRQYHQKGMVEEFVKECPDFEYVTDENIIRDLVKLLPSTGDNNLDAKNKDVLQDLFSEYERFEQLKRIADCVTCQDADMKHNGLIASHTLALIELAQAIRQGKIVEEVWELP